MTKDEAVTAIRALWDYAGWCHCGDPEAAAFALRDMLAAFPAWEKRDAQAGAFGVHAGRALILRYVLDNLGLTEHGGSCSGAWLTKRGEGVLAALMTEEAIEAAFDDETFPDAAEIAAAHDLAEFWRGCSGPMSGNFLIPA